MAKSETLDQTEEFRRLTREALEDVEQARVVDHQAVLSWAESLTTDKPLPSPKSNSL